MAEKAKEETAMVTNDEDFLARLENYKLTLAEFDHVARLRAIWLYLVTHGWDIGVMNARHWFERFFTNKGANLEYHATAVQFWCRAVWEAMGQGKESDGNFAAFLAAHPYLDQETLIGEFYSPEILLLDAAKHRPFPSDLKPLDELKAYQPKNEPAEEKKETSKATGKESTKKKET